MCFTQPWPSNADGVVQNGPASAHTMDASEVGTLLRRWFAGERLEVREQQDPRADVHLAVKYPPVHEGTLSRWSFPRGVTLSRSPA